MHTHAKSSWSRIQDATVQIHRGQRLLKCDGQLNPLLWRLDGMRLTVHSDREQLEVIVMNPADVSEAWGFKGQSNLRELVRWHDNDELELRFRREHKCVQSRVEMQIVRKDTNAVVMALDSISPLEALIASTQHLSSLSDRLLWLCSNRAKQKAKK